MGGSSMNKRVMVIVTCLALFSAVVVAIWQIYARSWLAYGQSHERTNSPPHVSRVVEVRAIDRPEDETDISRYVSEPYKRVNEKAGAINGADERAIRELADALMPLIADPRLPTAIVSPFLKRVTQAEIDYRRGRKAGIPEFNIVRVIDHLATTFGAPKYARTDEDEVRAMRLSTSQMIPNFIPRRPLGAGEESWPGISYTVDPLMSPLEAVYVTRLLIMQKEHSEFSLLTTEERAEIKTAVDKLKEMGVRLTLRERAEVMMALTEQKLYPEKHQQRAEELAAEAQRRSAERENTRTGTFLRFERPLTPRFKEMQEVFDRAYRMNVSDALELANRAIELLGI
jgi:hypothetical protein